MTPLTLLTFGAAVAIALVPLALGDAAAETAKKLRVPASMGAALSAGPSAKAAKDMPVMLRNQVMLDGSMIRLGDLFRNAPADKVEIPIAYAPSPGRRAVFDARWLYRTAHANGLTWRPLSRKVQAVVERRSRVVGRREIEALVMDVLRERGLEDNEIVELSNRITRIHLPTDNSARIDIEDIYHDERTGRMTAFLVAQTGEPGAQRMRITGTIFRTVDVPIIKRHIMPGEIIRKRDIDFQRRKVAAVRRDTVLDLATLVGMTPIRGARAGAPVRITEIRRPLVIDKGGLVTIVHKIDQMMLTAQGKALDAGSTGDTIRVRNVRSKTVVEARVVGPSQVVVGTNPLTALH